MLVIRLRKNLYSRWEREMHVGRIEGLTGLKELQLAASTYM
jgi:hypothetical protein